MQSNVRHGLFFSRAASLSFQRAAGLVHHMVSLLPFPVRREILIRLHEPPMTKSVRHRTRERFLWFFGEQVTKNYVYEYIYMYYMCVCACV